MSGAHVSTARGPHKKSLLRRCFDGKLPGGLSVSLRATPDELIGPLLHALGVTGFRLVDVRTGAPMVLEVAFREVHEKWELVDLEALVHNLNDLFRHSPELPVIVVLGEWQDMLQLWCAPRGEVLTHLNRHLLDDARNLRTLWAILEPVESDP
jgi:hypothetical protein